MNQSLLPSRFLFRFAAPCHYAKLQWGSDGITLNEDYRLLALSELEGMPVFADVRVAWSEAGLAFDLRVEGKRQGLWCRETRLAESDGLQVFIDTRDTHNVHRASRFCHRFALLPAGGGRKFEKPIADQLLVDRARENAKPIRPDHLKIAATVRSTGYRMSAFLPADTLTGFQPDENPRLGFTYSLFDREFGEQTWSIGSELPFASDPSLWGTLDLVK